MSLTLTNVGFSFGRKTILSGVSFTCESTERAVIIGPGGEGKTVLLKIVAGLLSPTEGTVQTPKRVSMVFQRNGLFDSMSVIENVEFPLFQMKSENPTERAMELLGRVGLSPYAKKRTYELSGGQQKRLGLVRAWASSPELLLYDDPTAGLDPVTSREISNLIVEEQATRGHGVFLVTSDLGVANRVATKIGFLNQGKIAEWNTSENIHSSTNPYVRQFILGLEQGPLSP